MNTTNMTIDPHTQLPLLEKMIYNLAWRTASTYGMSYEECLSEAYFGFMYACAHFREGKGTRFSTYCHFIIGCKLRDLVAKRVKSRLVYMEINDEVCGEDPSPHRECQEMIEDLISDLSGDAREILQLLVETPAEISRGVLTTGSLLRQIYNHLKRVTGIDRNHFELALAEIRQSLQEKRA